MVMEMACTAVLKDGNISVRPDVGREKCKGTNKRERTPEQDSEDWLGCGGLADHGI